MAALRKLLIRGLTGCGILAAATLGAAQMRLLPGVDQNAPEPKDATEGIFVPESSLALERLALAEKMERLKEWNKSADLYQEVLTDPKYTGKVVSAEQSDSHRLFRSVEDLVMQHLSRWPAEGLEVYRGRYETQAQALLDSAKPGDLHTLHQVFSRYFVTEAGKNAGIRLMDLNLEQGEFRAVVSIGEKLLSNHPGLGDDRPAILFRGAIALHLSREDAAAHARLVELQQQFPQARALVRGRDAVLADALADELKQPISTATGASQSDSYSTFGGDATRNHVAAASGTPGAHLYSIEMSRPAFAVGAPGQQQEALYKEAVKTGGTLGVVPVVDRSEMFFQDGQRIYGVNLESGVPLPGWIKTNGADHSGSFKFNGAGEPVRLRQLTLTATDHAILGIMGRADPSMMRIAPTILAAGTLVCVDRQSGRLNWQVNAQQLKVESLRGLQFGGSPLVVGDNVLIAATASKQAGFEDCYVLCFDINDATLRWSTNVASAMTTGMNPLVFNNGFGITFSPNDSHLAYANGLAYVQSNRGVVAAVDVYSGSIAWLSTYHRGDQATNVAFNPMLLQNGSVQPTAGKPWAFNPVIITQGLVFTLPLEGKHLLIYDAVSGATVKQIDLDDLSQRLRSDDLQQMNLDTLIGVNGDMLLIGGGRSIVAVNWRKYDGDHYNDETMLYWEEDYKGDLCGRPFLTRDTLYVALDERMYMVNINNGAAVKEYPAYPRVWGDDEGPGNLVVTGDHAIVAGAEHIDVYTDLTAAKHRLDAEVAEYPNAPEPRLRYAEVTYAAGDYPTSLTKLDEAIARAGGPPIPQGEVRDRIFNDALNFAQKLRNDETTDGRDRVTALYDRAGAAAYSPEQQVHYRLSRAAFDQLKSDPASAVERFQQILSDAQWRAVVLPDEASQTPVSADRVARQSVAKLIKADPSLYQKFEAEAAAALEKAKDSNDPQQLLEVAQAYPNSSVAGSAMLAGADAFEQAGQPQLARHVLLDMYFDRDFRASDRALVAEALARTDSRTAARLLAAASAEQSDAKLQKTIRLFDGTELAAGMSFAQAAKQAGQAGHRAVATTLPAFALPMPPKPDADGNYPKPFAKDGPVLPAIDALLTPVAGFARNDRVVVWTTEPKLSVYSAALDQPLGINKEIIEEPEHSAWLGDDLVVWGAKQIALLRDDGKTLAWTLDITKLPSIDALTVDETAETPVVQPQMINAPPMIMPGIRIRRGFVPMPIIPIGPGPVQAPQQGPGPERITRVQPVGKLLLVTTSTGRVACIDLKHHQLRWQVRLMDRAVEQLLASEDFTVIVAQNESTVMLEVVDTFSGHVRGSTPYARSTNSFPQSLALADDGTLVYTLPDRICFKDLFKPWSAHAVEQHLPNGTATFYGMTGPQQLLIAGNRVVALADSGGANPPGEKFVHVYALDGGAAVTVPVAEKQQVELALTAGTKQQRTRLAVAGSRLFTIAPDASNSYDLDHLDQPEAIYSRDIPPVWQSFLGSDFHLMITDDVDPEDVHPIPAGNAPLEPKDNHKVLINAFGRYQTPHGEATRLDYQFHLAEEFGVTLQWQPVDGGLVYRSNDHKVHLLVGAGKK
jgi:outer membrane protein assembly factor BamB